MTSVVSINKSKVECENCRVVKFFGAEVVECLEKLDCQWAVISGYGHFCKHPSSLQRSGSGVSRLFT